MPGQLRPLFFYLTLLGFSLKGFAQNYSIVWEDSFGRDEQEMVHEWMEKVEKGRDACFGKYPFKPVYYIHSRTSSGEPVPWAHTTRSSVQGVHFYIDNGYALNAFIEDWTAPHEIAHLALPFVGKENMWFSEGFASFMQYQVMLEMGVLQKDELEEMYHQKASMALSRFSGEGSFTEACGQLLKTHDYPAIYWGGACYFMKTNRDLERKKNSSLVEVIRHYQKDYRMKDRNLEEVIQSLDEVSGTRLFSENLDLFQNESCNTLVEILRQN